MSEMMQKITPIYSQLADDPDLYDLVKMFVDEMPTRIDRLISNYTSKDWDELQRTAHQLKGAAGSYGFCEVTPVAGKLEQSLQKQLPEEQIQQTLDELIDLCRRMAIN